MACSVSCPLNLARVAFKRKGASCFWNSFEKLKMKANGSFVLNFGEITEVKAQKSKNGNRTAAQPKPKGKARKRGCL